MLLTNLADLDELVLQVRNQGTRTYVAEAVIAYRGGAYRAAWVALWVAVVFDVVAKLRELAALGDANAASKMAELDRWIAANAASKLQAFERDLLQLAHSEFEFLSAHELTELQRLREDRHLCAHPAFVAEDRLFAPEAEQVRAYLKCAVASLFSQQPLQGKWALERIRADLASESFPHRPADIEAFMRNRYLGSAKVSLVRNLVIVLLKGLLHDSEERLPIELYSYRFIHVLRAVRRIRPEVYEPVMRERLPALAGAVDDEQLDNVYPLLRSEERAWEWLDEPTRLRLRTHLHGRGLSDPSSPLVDALAIPQLDAEIASVLTRTSEALLEVVIDATFRSRALLTHVLKLLATADTFRQAEQRLESLVLPLAPGMTETDVGQVLQTTLANDQVWKARRTPHLLEQLFEATQRLYPTTWSVWQSFLAQLPQDEHEEEYGADYGPLTRIITAVR